MDEAQKKNNKQALKATKKELPKIGNSLNLNCSGGGTRTHDLRIMNLKN